MRESGGKGRPTLTDSVMMRWKQKPSSCKVTFCLLLETDVSS